MCETLENDMKHDYTTMVGIVNEKMKSIEQVNAGTNAIIDATVDQQKLFDRESQMGEHQCTYLF